MNKPIVRGTLEGKQGKIFLDSGAEINVIDSTLLVSLMEESKGITVEKKETDITCANGSRMSSKGIAMILVGYGSYSSYQRFVIVDEIFPKVFIGIKAMKHMNVKIDPRNECAKIRKVKLPFISGVESTTSDAGNAQQSTGRVNN